MKIVLDANIFVFCDLADNYGGHNADDYGGHPAPTGRALPNLLMRSEC